MRWRHEAKPNSRGSSAWREFGDFFPNFLAVSPRLSGSKYHEVKNTSRETRSMEGNTILATDWIRLAASI